jgi:DNA adenine methylase
MKDNLIKSPLNYIGGKYKILNQILPLFPKQIDRFIDLFAGGCNVGINVNANKITFNDNLIYLIELFNEFRKNSMNFILEHIDNRISEFSLSQTNKDGYKQFREYYNQYKNPLDLFVLVAYSFNHQIRFNNSHQFNNPFGKNRSSFNETMKSNLIKFITKLQNSDVEFLNKDFSDFDFSILTKDDFVYCDPPYLITTGTYNDGKRGFKGWDEVEEIKLLNILNDLNKNDIRFALSNVLEHKGESNILLKEWIEQNHYNLHYLNKNYANSNYQTKVRDKKATIEVLITNYKIEKEKTLFDYES